MVDDVPELGRREALADRRQRRHGRIDSALALRPVALDARELDERVRAGGHLRGHLRRRDAVVPDPAAWIVSVCVCVCSP